MKRIIITVIMLIFSISLCIGQTLQQEAERHRQIEAQQRQAEEEQKRREAQSLREEAERQKRIQAEAEKKRQEAEAKQRQELEQRYQDAISSAQSNLNLQKYEQAKQNYRTALDIKPENAATINPKIAEIDKILQQQEEAERERKYQDAVASAQRKFNQKQYKQAKLDYEAALKLKPENSSFINAKIDEIDRKMNEPATLYLYRKRWYEGYSTNTRLEILLDNVLIGIASNNWKITKIVNTFGKKNISTTVYGKKAEVQVNVEPGGVYYIQCAIAEGRAILRLVDKYIGESDFNSIKD